MRNLSLFLTIAALCLVGFAKGQPQDFGAWWMYFGMNKFHEKWSIHSEAQHRNHTVEPNIEQLLLRTGLNWHFGRPHILTLGYGYITGHTPNEDILNPNTVEHRIFQQFITLSFIKHWRLEHRFRLEQRWIEDIYRNRVRYRLQASYPLNGKKIQAGVAYLNFYDEIFINFQGNAFDRNRVYGALGYQFHHSVQAQLGILNQAVPNSNKWNLQLALLLNPDWTK